MFLPTNAYLNCTNLQRKERKQEVADKKQKHILFICRSETNALAMILTKYLVKHVHHNCLRIAVCQSNE